MVWTINFENLIKPSNGDIKKAIGRIKELKRRLLPRNDINLGVINEVHGTS